MQAIPHKASVLAIWPGGGNSWGGAVSHIAGILGAFQRAGVRVGLVTASPPPQQVVSAVDDLEICPPLASHARLTGDTSEIVLNRSIRRAANALAARLRPAFVYQRHCGFLFAGVEVSRRLSVPLVLEWNGSEVWIRQNYAGTLPPERLLNRLAAAIERSALRSAALVAAVSEQAADMAVAAGASPGKTMVVPNGVDLQYVDAASNGHAPQSTSLGDALLGWAGSFGPTTYGGEIIVRAMSRLPETIRLLMIGEGPERHLCQRLADQLGIGGRIEWTGVLPHRDTLQQLAKCDILVAPYIPLPEQLFFGSPIKLFEYMALSRPIVASRLGQISEMLKDGVTGRLVEPGDVRDLSAAILDVLQSPDRGQALGDAARREVEKSHTWDHRASAVLRRVPLTFNTEEEVQNAVI
jgi:glycosyltransferase involved in cell wall biosynthesis